jgi:Uma2 family endonuclease
VFVDQLNLGVVAGGKGPIRLSPALVRLPDVSFIRWDSVEDPDEIENPAGAFLEYPPDLAVEVLSPGNTRREMEIKLEEYAKAGVKLVWYVDPEWKEVDVFPKANPKRKKTVGVGDTLDGGDVLPGFTLPVAKTFEKRAPARKPGKKRPNGKR